MLEFAPFESGEKPVLLVSVTEKPLLSTLRLSSEALVLREEILFSVPG